MAEARAQIDIVAADRTGAAFASVDRKLGGLSANLSRIKTAFGALGGAFAAVQVARFIGHVIEAGDELNRAAIKSGIAAKAFTELAFAAKMSDVETGQLSVALKKMQVALSQAGSGIKGPITALQALGLEIRDLQQLSPDRQFELLADRISQLKDPADKTRAAVELFGKAGADLLPMFAQGAEGIREARQEAERLGLSFSGEQLAALADADDAIKRLKASFSGLATVLIAEVAPALSQFFNNMTALINGDKIGKLKEQIDFLQRQRESGFLSVAYGDIGTGVFSPEETEAKLRELEATLARLSGGGRSVRGGQPFAGAGAGPPGFLPDPKKAAKDWHDEWAAAIASYNFDRELFAKYMPAIDAGDPEIDFGITSVEAAQVRVQQDLDQMSYAFEESAAEWTTYVDQAARNMQDSLAEFLFDPFKDGLDGMLKGFVDTLRRMLAEMAASQVFKWLGGAMSGSSNSWISAAGAFFAGKAAGGPVSAGKPYMVGERGPELFIPGQGGSIVPNGKLGGGGAVVNISNHIDARGATTDLAKQLPAILEASNRRAVQMARKAINDDWSRGAFGRA